MIKQLLISIFCLMLTTTSVFSQSMTVTGIVKSSPRGENSPTCIPVNLSGNFSIKKVRSLESLPGVMVIVKGTQRMVSTNADGQFSIKVQPDDILVLSFVGFKTIEVKVKNKKNLGFIVLWEEKAVLSGEMIHYGRVACKLGFHEEYAAGPLYFIYGRTYKDQVDFRGYATSTVYGGNTFVTQSIPSLGFLSNGITFNPNQREILFPSALQGKVPGLEVIDNTGTPGSGTKVRLRGHHSIQGSNLPLIVLNGMPINSSLVNIPFNETYGQSRLNDLPVTSTEEVEVVKGSVGTARWGGFGSNGAIYITSPRPLPYRANGVSFKSSWAIDEISKTIPLQTTYGQGFQGMFNQYSLESWGDLISNRPGGTDILISNVNDPNYLGRFENNRGKNYYTIAPNGKSSQSIYNPYQTLFVRGQTLTNALRIHRSWVNFNIEDTQQKGIVENNSHYRRINSRLTLNRRKTNPWSGIKQVASSLELRHTYSRSIQANNQIMKGVLLTAPDIDISDFEGTYIAPSGAQFPNRQRSMDNPLGRQAINTLDNPLWSMHKNPSRNRLNRFIGRFNLLLEDYRRRVLLLIVGHDAYQDNISQSFSPFSANYPLGASTHHQLNQGQWFAQLYIKGIHSISTSAKIQVRWAAGLMFNHLSATRFSNYTGLGSTQDMSNFTTQNLGGYVMGKIIYKQSLFIGFTSRYEYDSKLQSTFYPGVNLTLYLTRPEIDQYFREFIDYIRLRVAWAKTGNNLQRYFSNNLYNSSNFSIGQDLTPEIVNEVEAGLETRLFQRNIYAGITFYQNQTNRAILSENVGGVTRLRNAGRLTNRGVELEINAVAIKNKHFNWSLNAQYSRNLNQITDLGGQPNIVLNEIGQVSSRATINHALGVLYGTHWKKDDLGNLLLTNNGFPQKDTTQKIIADPNPQFKLALGSKIRYKKLELDILLDGSFGGQIWNGTKQSMYRVGTHKDTDHTIHLTPNQAASLPIYGTSGNGTTVANQYSPNTDGTYTVRGKITNFGQNDVLLEETWYRNGLSQVDESFVEDASWTRLREISLSYFFHGKCFRLKTKLQSIRLSITARNLFVWTRYSGFDPETFYWGQNGQVRGVDYFNPPNTKSYIFTVQITY